MLENLPNYLKIALIGLFVITFIAALLRRNLYRQLRDEGKRVRKFVERAIIDEKDPLNKPPIIEIVESRFKRASQQLERVNTPALIDGIYSENPLKFLGFSLSCEQWDYVTKVLPNLLISMGLLGTFLGITLNLSSISEILDRVDAIEASNLIEKLQIPLGNMGIAFTTSLVAIFCNLLLILVNLRYNTDFAKCQLIASLEDYLDNILHPTIDGHTRLDKAVNRMVDKQTEFLTRFHEKVGQVLESTLGNAAKQITAENQISNQLAREIYNRLLESSGALSTGASTFKESVSSLKKETGKLVTVSNNFQQSCNILKVATEIFSISSEKIEASKFYDNLEKLTADLANTQTNFARSSSVLEECVREIMTTNKKANQLAEQVYNQLEKSTGSLEKSAAIFQEASQLINQSEFADRFSTTTTDLVNTQRNFSESAIVLDRGTRSIDSAIQTLQTSVKEMVYLGEQQLNTLNKQSTQLIKTSQNNQKSLNKIATQLEKEVQNITQLQGAVKEIVHLGERQLLNNKEELCLGDRNI